MTQYRTRAILEYLDIIKPKISTIPQADLATPGSIKLGHSQDTRSGDSSIPSQQEMHKTMIDMRVSLHCRINTLEHRD